MTALLFGHDKTVAEWVYARAKVKPSSDPFSAFGLVDSQGTLQGGFVFTGYTGDSIELSMAGRAAATRGAINAMLNYVFVQLKCSRLEMNTRKSNKRVKRMLRPAKDGGLGVTYEGISRRLYGREDGVRYSLTSDDLPAFRMRWRLPP